MPIDCLNQPLVQSLYKKQIIKSFDRAALTYDSFANFQERVLTRLLTLCPALSKPACLDLGCGTGNGASFLNALSGSVVALDFSSEMLAQARIKYGNNVLVCADAERLPFAAESFDLVLSNLMMQWSKRPTQLIEEVAYTLRHDGYFLASTLCRGSMAEIEQCWRNVDGCPHINHYLAYDEQVAELLPACLELEFCACEPLTMWFDMPEDAIHSIKKIGASVLIDNGQKQRISPSAWYSFLSEYEKLREDQGIPLTYQVMYFLLRKK